MVLERVEVSALPSLESLVALETTEMAGALPLVPAMALTVATTTTGPRGGQYNSPGGGYNDGYGGPPNGPPQDRYGGPPHDGRDGPNYGMGAANASPQAAGPHQGSVLMVYGLNSEKMNADKLFNLLCLYGNVVRIKFLKSKDGCAMVQMGDPLAVERAVGHLNNAQFFDSKMQLGYSKQAFLNDVQLPFELPDGTPSFKDFMGNRNNRFTNPEAASKNRIQPPSRVLHFFNTPFGITEDDLKKLFEDLGCPVPTTIKMFTSKSKSASFFQLSKSRHHRRAHSGLVRNAAARV
ncbi:hypothetical protein HPB50_022566 [Hyalomma asiaticum]|uniref:Uncharacterized protein n=1 Tax=Hyalomma asiaticum TaxID=266040 RepID=A0ACB7RX94_HYAAI|nr:hypothetical protein HPB50_022566 [Hyalomma asiaticum]